MYSMVKFVSLCVCVLFNYLICFVKRLNTSFLKKKINHKLPISEFIVVFTHKIRTQLIVGVRFLIILLKDGSSKSFIYNNSGINLKF